MCQRIRQIIIACQQWREWNWWVLSVAIPTKGKIPFKTFVLFLEISTSLVDHFKSSPFFIYKLLWYSCTLSRLSPGGSQPSIAQQQQNRRPGMVVSQSDHSTPYPVKCAERKPDQLPWNDYLQRPGGQSTVLLPGRARVRVTYLWQVVITPSTSWESNSRVEGVPERTYPIHCCSGYIQRKSDYVPFQQCQDKKDLGKCFKLPTIQWAVLQN